MASNIPAYLFSLHCCMQLFSPQSAKQSQIWEMPHSQEWDEKHPEAGQDWHLLGI